MERFVSVSFTEDKIAIITLKDGENRLNTNSIAAWNNALDIVERSDSKVLLTTGEGKFYSNGVDLEWIAKNAQDHDLRNKLSDDLNDLFWRIMHFPIPTVAVLNGHAFAGGAMLAICHDFRVMTSERGWLCWNEVKIKRPFPLVTVEILRRKITSAETIREAIVLGKRFTAKEAADQGLVDALCAKTDLLRVGKKLALDALGPTGLDKNILQTMKKDFYPRTINPKSKI